MKIVTGIRRLLAVSLLNCLAINTPGSAQNSQPPRNYLSATSTFQVLMDRSGCLTTQSVTRRFTPVSIYEHDKQTRLVLSEVFDVLRCEEAEEAIGVTSVSAAPYDSAQISKPIWSFRVSGSSGEAWLEQYLYRVTRYGCCDAGDLDTYFSIRTGMQLFASSDSVIRIDVPNTGFRRYLAYHDNISAGEVPESERDSMVIGVLQYGDDRSPAARLVFARDGNLSHDTHGFRLIVDGKPVDGYDLTLWSADGTKDTARIGGFSVQIDLQPYDSNDDARLRIEVPITADRFDIGRIKLPKGVRIVESRK